MALAEPGEEVSFLVSKYTSVLFCFKPTKHEYLNMAAHSRVRFAQLWFVHGKK